MNTSGKSSFWLITLVVIVLGIGSILFLLNNQSEEVSSEKSAEQVLVIPEISVEPDIPDFETEEPENVAEAEHMQLEVEKVVLPALSESDAEFMQDLLAVSPELKAGLFKDQLIKKYIFAINDVSQGLRPSVKLLRELALTKPFEVIQVEGKMYISAQSYQRYDQLAQALNSIDNAAIVALYKKYLPLFQIVFNEFSYPPGYQVPDIIRAAAGKILQAPVVTSRIDVIRPTVHYKFADPELEKLSALDKQMLRMGPDNTRLIQGKLREIIQVLTEEE